MPTTNSTTNHSLVARLSPVHRAEEHPQLFLCLCAWGHVNPQPGVGKGLCVPLAYHYTTEAHRRNTVAEGAVRAVGLSFPGCNIPDDSAGVSLRQRDFCNLDILVSLLPLPISLHVPQFSDRSLLLHSTLVLPASSCFFITFLPFTCQIPGNGSCSPVCCWNPHVRRTCSGGATDQRHSRCLL